MDDLSNFFSTISVGKKQRKEEIDSIVGDAVNDFFSTISEGKKKVKEERSEVAGDSFDKLFWEELTKPTPKPKKKKKVVLEKVEEPKETIQEIIEEVIEHPKEVLEEKSLGLLSEPSDVKQQTDPLTPLDQKFATLDDLQKHYNLFLSRIQQQLSTLGGGGETNLAYMDMPITYVTSNSYTITPKDYYIGVNYAGRVNITLPTPKKNGKIYIVKDERGEASKGNNRHIYIYPSGSDLIDNENYAVLAYDYGSLTFVYRNGWRVV